ncbi:CBS domain-containing protein [Archangium gephyra]|uniref:CBS domain protein n=1 Tax=Archangium gephyra TaxID=48 RepID=A0AAC8Q065_9BACT|nr:CBS domain-containing protein [Archangium gephyra]AKI98547.1 CBS domain protein [Archangium gephyra]REG20355.1 CBS domain-containing protein [Archangium gephyra]
MAQRHTDDGRDTPARSSPPNGTHAERERRAAESPPGSRERSESDVTGWSTERDEPPEVREGRFHRAAQLRMAQPRTEEGAPPPEDDTRFERVPQRRGLFHRGRGRPVERPSGLTASVPHGPYGRDDRNMEDAAGMGSGPLLGEQERYHALEDNHPQREYRPWDRSGTGQEPSGNAPYEDRGGREVRGEARGPELRGGPGQRGREEHWREDRPGAEQRAGTGDVYSGLMGMGQTGTQRTETQRQGRWKREPLNAREIMTRNVKSAQLDSSLREVARIMKDEDCGVVPVVDKQGRLRGLITDRDLVIRTLAEGRPPDTLHARDIMTDDVEVVTPDEDIHSIIALMGRRQVRRVPVVEKDDRLVGIISMADIATRADYDEELQDALDHISARRSFWSRLY